MFQELSDTQATLRPGFIELGLGHPDPSLLALDALIDGARNAAARFGPNTINYGHGIGPGPLREWLVGRISRQEGAAPTDGEIAITAGISHGLDQLATLWLQPGDAVFAQSPTYHLALRILRDRNVTIIPVASDADGLSDAALRAAIDDARARNLRPRLLYAVPSFNNPTGLSWSPARREQVVETAAAHSLLIAEDDAYRELGYDAPAPPSLWSIAPRGVVARFGSFSKSLAAGMRVGWLTADAALVTRIAKSGLMDSGGGPSQFAAMCVTAFCTQGDAYDRQLARLVNAYRDRRDALVREIQAQLPGCTFDIPRGGFFLWLNLPAQVDAAALHRAAEGQGVSFLTGARFFADGRGGANAIRLCFALYDADMLTEGVRRIALALRLCK